MGASLDRAAMAGLLLVVALMAAGQLLFKATALAWRHQGTLWATPVLTRLGVALAIYGVATLAWIWLLQRLPLSLAYPFVALSFVLVPLGAWWWFAEKPGLWQLAGAALIVAGIVVSSVARNPG